MSRRLVTVVVVFVLVALAGPAADAGAGATPTPDRREAQVMAADVRATITEVNAQLLALRAGMDARRLAVGQSCYDTLLALGGTPLNPRAASAALAGYLLYTLGDGMRAIVSGPTTLLARIGPKTKLRTPELRRARAALKAVDQRQRATTFPPVTDYCGPLRTWSTSRFTPGTMPGTFADALVALQRVQTTPAEDAALGLGAAVLRARGGLGARDAGAFADTSLETETQRLFSDPVVGVLFLATGALGS